MSEVQRVVEPVSARQGGLGIGERLRAARQARRLTISQVADAAGLTKGFISRLERNAVSPSVASLITVCEVVGLRVGALFDPDDTQVIREADARFINFGGEGVREWLMTPGTQSQLQVIRSSIDAGGSGGGELYTLDCEVEFVYVIKGHVDVQVGDTVYELRRGDGLTLRGREPHTWRNSSRHPAEVIWVLTPAP